MEITDKDITTSVEQLKQYLLSRRTSKVRFKLNMTEEMAYNYLLTACMAEVEYRHREFIYNDEVKSQLNQMAHWLTSDNSKFGILLCGECGNGKYSTTAFQTSDVRFLVNTSVHSAGRTTGNEEPESFSLG